MFERTWKSSLMSGSQSQSVAIGDLNNDRHMDIVVANTGTDTIGLFISKGDGTFEEQKPYSTGSNSRPYSIVVSNFNNDNYLDIAVANYAINSIGIFLGYGNGTFANQTLFSLGSSRPFFISIGDFNNDNQTDIVIANDGTDSIGILFGRGNGSFRNPITFSTGYDSLPYSLVVGDFNRDNQLDIAIANHDTNNIQILLGLGNGSFINQHIYTTLSKSNPSSITMGDMNNDTYLDIIVANNGTRNIGIFLGHGDGSFSPQTVYLIRSNSHPEFVAVGDLDNDNILDIAVVDSQNDQVHVLSGSGNGSFRAIATYDTALESHPVSIALADFNNDNQSDIVVVHKDANSILVLIEFSTEEAVRQKKYKDRGSIGSGVIGAGDFNNDEIFDIVSVTQRSISLLVGLSDGNFQYTKTMYFDNGLSTPQYISVGDFNNDNRMDFVVVLKDSDMVGVFLGDGNGTFSTMTTYSTGNESKPIRTVLGDFNGDGQLDIVSTNTGSDTLGILIGNGNGTFDVVKTHPTVTGHTPYSILAVDMNEDSYLDLIVGDDRCTLTVFLGYGNGNFLTWDIYFSVDTCILTSLALFDFNHDIYLDVIATSPSQDGMHYFVGAPDATFGRDPTETFGYGFGPSDVAVIDFDGDNADDVVLPIYGADEIYIFYGNNKV